MTDAQAEEWLGHLSALADVTVQAFIEQRSQAAAAYAVAEPLTVGHADRLRCVMSTWDMQLNCMSHPS